MPKPPPNHRNQHKKAAGCCGGFKTGALSNVLDIEGHRQYFLYRRIRRAAIIAIWVLILCAVGIKDVYANGAGSVTCRPWGG